MGSPGFQPSSGQTGSRCRVHQRSHLGPVPATATHLAAWRSQIVWPQPGWFTAKPPTPLKCSSRPSTEHVTNCPDGSPASNAAATRKTPIKFRMALVSHRYVSKGFHYQSTLRAFGIHWQYRFMLATDHIGLDELSAIETPDVRCSFGGCSVLVWNEDELTQCEACGGKRYCSDHVKAVHDCYFCDECRVCVGCCKPATLLNSDGDLSCGIVIPRGFDYWPKAARAALAWWNRSAVESREPVIIAAGYSAGYATFKELNQYEVEAMARVLIKAGMIEGGVFACERGSL